MSSSSETIMGDTIRDDDELKKDLSSSSIHAYAFEDSNYYAQAPVADVSVLTKGIPSEASLIPNGGGGYQWHLNDTWGINAHEVWDEYTGDGVLVAVFDEGIDYNHPDLAINYRTDLDFDTSGGNDNDAIAEATDRHGTAVAGVIAADDNGTGAVGVAFDAELLGIRRDFSTGSFTDTVEGFEHTLASGADVMNNSWGASTLFADNPIKNYFGDDTTEVIDSIIDLVNFGRGGLGTSIVFSAGNSRGADDNVNYHGYQNNPYVITVAGTNIDGELYGSSTPGAAILVGAPGQMVTTTDVSGAGGYVAGDTVTINGTSFSAPTVSGVVALMYEANADLGYRDVHEILAMSGRQINDSAWQTNGNANWNGSGMHFSHDYGYGLVDAFTAVRLAETWSEQKTYANMQTVSVSDTPNISTIDNGTLQHTITVTDDISIERVSLELILPHARAGELTVSIISPDGTESFLVETAGSGSLITDVHGFTGLNFEFGSTAHLGESSAGDWTLRIHDNNTANSGTLEFFDLQFFGSAQSDDDTYYFTDEFDAVILADSAGIDTLNLAAVRNDVTLVMTSGASSTINGETLRLSNGTVVENAILGDGNDTVTGNQENNVISTGRGDDYIFATSGDDTIDAGTGNDTIQFSGNLGDYTVEFLDALTVRLTDNLGGGGVDVVTNVETFIFNNAVLTSVELEDVVENPVPVDPIILRFGWNSTASYYRSEAVEMVTLTATDLNVTDASGDLVSLDRTATSLDIAILDPVAQDIESFRMSYGNGLNLTVDGARSNDIILGGVTSSSVILTNTMAGRVQTGDGNDTVTVTLAEIDAPAADVYRIYTQDGNDNITVGGTHSSIQVVAFGGSGDDIITVSVTGNHYIYGEIGNDTIIASAGDEIIYGGDGSDNIQANAGTDRVLGGDGNDIISGGDGNDYLYGDAGADIVHGGTGDDLIRGGTADDTLNGDNGNDLIYGDSGNDLINGGEGVDEISGGTGHDTINGNNGNDELYGDSGDDIINGGVGFDIIRGGDGNDQIFGNEDSDRIYGQDDDDEIHGGDGNDRLYGGGGIDILYGDDGSDALYGGAGDDTVTGGAGIDFLYGNTGADTFVLDAGSVDRIRDFQLAEGDRIDISDLITGYNSATDDLNEFVILRVVDATRSNLLVDSDGGGDNYVYSSIIFGNLTGQTVDTLETNNDLIV